MEPSNPRFEKSRDIGKSLLGSGNILLYGPKDEFGVHSFFELLSKCYSNHLPIAIKPQDIWFIIQTEITKIVNQSPEKYRHLFTESEEKTSLSIPTGNVELLPMETLINTLSEKLKFNVEDFCPMFSTMTPECVVASFSTLAESAANYYNYFTFCCGIPKIKILGTYEDWQLIRDSMYKLALIFGNEVSKYLCALSDLVFKIYYDRGEEFWKNIYTQKNIGSGGELSIDGWITDLFYFKPELKKLENYTFSYSKVPYENIETGRKFNSIHGQFGYYVDSEGFYNSKFVEYITEIKK